MFLSIKTTLFHLLWECFNLPFEQILLEVYFNSLRTTHAGGLCQYQIE